MIVTTYLGKAWVNGGQGPDAYDCWGLVRAIYKNEKSIEIPYFNVDALKPLEVRHAFQETNEYANWREVSEKQDLDVVLLSQASRPHHVGVWFQGKLLHAVEGAGVVWQAENSLKLHGWNIITTYRRF